MKYSFSLSHTHTHTHMYTRTQSSQEDWDREFLEAQLELFAKLCKVLYVGSHTQGQH